MTAPRRAAGFTLIEILMVIGIISILAGMILGLVANLRFRAASLTTLTRMQAVLDGLAVYSQFEGSTAASLQMNFALGGVGRFGSIDTISDVIDANATLNAGTIKPPLLVIPDYSGTVWSMTITEQKDQQKPQWKNVFDVLPSAADPASAAGYYSARWPNQWPTTDWLDPGVGTVPPILRFPWGKPGLTLSGELCDPNQAPTAVLRNAIEFNSLDNWRHNTNGTDVPVVNACVTRGSAASLPSGPTPAWKFTAADGSQTSHVTSTIDGRRSDGTTDVSVAANQPLPFDLGYLSPLKTIELLTAAEALPSGGAASYRTDRKPTRTWNDAWGNPLVVGYALFQPERYYRTWDRDNRRDLLLKGAQAAYGYSRSLYFAVGAVGPDRAVLKPAIESTGLAGSTGTVDDRVPLATIWKQICQVCDAQLWTEGSFTAPPTAFKAGISKGKKSGMRSFLSKPYEIR
jgi:prepilin-type N-terminal cleavage/methylation domain-containing protein